MAHTILVIGATGLLGEPVARKLLAASHDVRLLVRNPDAARAKLGKYFEYRLGDVEDEVSIKDAMTGCDGVYISLMGGPSPEDFDRVEHLGTARVARIAADLGLERLIYLSGAPVHKSNFNDPGTRAKYHAEVAIRRSGVPYTIFRSTWMMEALSLFVRGSRATLPGPQPYPLRWIAAEDYADLVTKAFSTPAAANTTLYAYGPQALTKGQALERYVEIARPDISLSVLPLWLLRLIAALSFNPGFQADIRRMNFYNGIGDDYGDDQQTVSLLGKPQTTLEQWCQQQSLKQNDL